MKRRLVCLTLSILMLLTCLLTSCGEKKTETPTDEVDNSAKTIVMWIIAGEGSDKEAQDAVSVLKTHGVDRIQGFALARPMPEDLLLDFYREINKCAPCSE